MTPDRRIDWCRENLHGFKEMNDRAEQVRQEEAENKRQMAPYMTPDQLQQFRPEVGE